MPCKQPPRVGTDTAAARAVGYTLGRLRYYCWVIRVYGCFSFSILRRHLFNALKNIRAKLFTTHCGRYTTVLSKLGLKTPSYKLPSPHAEVSIFSTTFVKFDK